VAGAVQAGLAAERTDPMNLPPAGRMVPRFANPALTAYFQAMPKHIEDRHA